MECKVSRNKDFCSCTYTSCSNHGVCCDCLRKHLKQRQLPACCFPPEIARTSERSFEKFIEVNS